MAQSIQVLHVDDEPDFGDLTATFLERENDELTVETATSAAEGARAVDIRPPDCIVSDYDMPDQNGIEFLERVRDEWPRLPFILFTGKGSEEIASEAISAGVTDYLQKGSGTEKYAVLANRIQNAVERVHAQRQRERQLDAIETAQEGISILDQDGHYLYVNDAFATLCGYDAEAMIGEHWELVYAEEDIPRVREEILPAVEQAGSWHGETACRCADGTTVEVDHTLAMTDRGELVCTVRDISAQKERKRELESLTSQYATLIEHFPDGGVFLFDEELQYVRAGGSELSEVGLSSADFEGQTPHDLFPDAIATETARHYRATLQGERRTYQQRYQGDEYEIRTIPISDDTGTITHGMSVSRNITDQVERKQELKQQNERLEEFASVVSHDLRNPLRVADARLELAQAECDSPHLDDAADAIDRSQALIEGLLELARTGDTVGSTEPVSLSELATECWGMIPTEAATLTVATTQTVTADRSCLRQLLENLLGNAVEHGGDVTVTVGDLADGFYVADDGSGVSESEREDIFDAGYSTAEGGTGFGLRIVKQIVNAHGWEIRVTDSEQGGARFEITGVDRAD